MAGPGPDDLVVTLSRLPMPGPWTARRRCRDVPPNVFFPTTGDDVEQAKAICAGCSVQSECLEYALPVRDLSGIWGGTTANERAQLRAGADDPDEEAVTSGPTELERGFHAAAGSLDDALTELARYPGHWARVGHFQSEGSAHSTASLLRTGRRRHPPGRWQFEGRVAEGGGSDLYAMLEAEDVAS